VRLISGSTITVIDNVAPDTDSTTGLMSLVGPIVIGAWTVNSLSATGFPVRGQGELQLVYNLTSAAGAGGTGAGHLEIQVTQNGYDTNVPEWALIGGGTGPAEQNVDFLLFGGTNNMPFDRVSRIIVDSGNLGGSSFSFNTGRSCSGFPNCGNSANPYSLTLVAFINAPSGFGTPEFSYSGNVTAVVVTPEPASILTLGIAIAALLFPKKRLDLNVHHRA